MAPPSDDEWNFPDAFSAEFDGFREDVFILIINTLKAGIESLSKAANAEAAEIEAALKKATNDDYQQHLIDERVGVLSQNAGQERFLRNMAVVALASRLTHALRKMAKAADHFKPGKKRYGSGSDSEFDRLWMEYTDRFSIDFVANATLIDFVEPMRKVRNQIVHDGGEANPFKSGTSFDDLGKGEDAYLDTSFSKAHPDFVSGEGMFAEVSVNQVQLQSMVDSALALVEWLATELRAQEMAFAATIK